VCEPEEVQSGDMASDIDIHDTIGELIAEEHRLREEVADGGISPDEEQTRLRQLEVALDQCWDLLRQRRAKREFGENPDDAELRSEGTVEGYLA
jgi:hypothetical protein